VFEKLPPSQCHPNDVTSRHKHQLLMLEHVAFSDMSELTLASPEDDIQYGVGMGVGLRHLKYDN